MRRREFIAGLGGAAAWSMTGHAQQADRVRRFGVLMVQEETNPEAQRWLVALRDGLEKLGWTEGQNIKFEYYWVAPDSNLIQQAAKQLVAVQPDLILSSSTPGIAALLQGTSTIPILFPNIVDPVGSGFATSLSRPGRNATGLVNLEASMAGKWLGLLKEVAPRVTRLVVPFNPATSPYAQIYLDYFTSSGGSLGVQVITAPVANITELETFAAAQAREPNTGLIPVPVPL
jgi:putative tryptophan/tyrosine transport system substrate-binding protein